MAFSEFIINNEVIFDVNMSELRPVNGNGESINLNGPTARCLQLLIESNGRIISREEFLESVWKTRGGCRRAKYFLSKHIIAQKITAEGWIITGYHCYCQAAWVYSCNWFLDRTGCQS